MFLIKIYIKESYINYYHTIIQMCGQYCILAPVKLWVFYSKFLPNSNYLSELLISSISIFRHVIQ